MTWGRPPNRQGFPNPSRFANGQGLPPPTLHDLQMDKGWGPRNPSRLGGGFQMDKGWADFQIHKGWGPPTPICKWTRVGAQPFTTPPQPCTTCRWTRVGGPNPSRLANGQGLGAPEPFTTCKPQILFGQALGPPNHRTLEHISQGTGSISTERNINDKPFVPECTIEQILNFA